MYGKEINALHVFQIDNGYQNLNDMLFRLENIQRLIQDISVKEEETFLTKGEEKLLDVLLDEEKTLIQFIHE